MQNPMNDSKLFGDADARNQAEIEGLKKYFVEFPFFRQIENGSQAIIVGVKGSGKSALRTKLIEKLSDSIVIDIEPMLPSNRLFDAYTKAHNLTDGTYNTYEKAWKAYIIGQILLRMRDQGIKWGNNPSLIKDILRRIGFSQSKDVFERITAISLGVEKIGNASISLEPNQIVEYLPSDNELPTLVSMIQEFTVRAECRIVVLLDRVDKELEDQFTLERIQSYRKYIGGLCLSVASINSLIEPRYLTVYTFIRSDLYEQMAIELHSVSEFESLVRNLDWKLEPLMDLVAKRIDSYFNPACTYSEAMDFRRKETQFYSQKLWYKVIEPPTLSGIGSWKYFLMHTHMKPRDIITLLDFCRRAAEHAGKSIIDGSSIKNGMLKYSQRKMQEFQATYRYRIPNIQKMMNLFRTSELIWQKAEFTNILNELISLGVEDLGAERDSSSKQSGLLSLLYSSGFIVSQANTNGLPFVGSYSSPYFNIESAPLIAIHPAYHLELRSGLDNYDFRFFYDDFISTQTSR